jgi:hypothetical protein
LDIYGESYDEGLGFFCGISKWLKLFDGLVFVIEWLVLRVLDGWVCELFLDYFDLLIILLSAKLEYSIIVINIIKFMGYESLLG